MIERVDAVLIIGLNLPAKRNAFDLTMPGELATVYGVSGRSPSVR